MIDEVCLFSTLCWVNASICSCYNGCSSDRRPLRVKGAAFKSCNSAAIIGRRCYRYGSYHRYIRWVNGNKGRYVTRSAGSKANGCCIICPAKYSSCNRTCENYRRCWEIITDYLVGRLNYLWCWINNIIEYCCRARTGGTAISVASRNRYGCQCRYITGIGGCKAWDITRSARGESNGSIVVRPVEYCTYRYSCKDHRRS